MVTDTIAAITYVYTSDDQNLNSNQKFLGEPNVIDFWEQGTVDKNKWF